MRELIVIFLRVFERGGAHSGPMVELAEIADHRTIDKDFGISFERPRSVTR